MRHEFCLLTCMNCDIQCAYIVSKGVHYERISDRCMQGSSDSMKEAKELLETYLPIEERFMTSSWIWV